MHNYKGGKIKMEKQKLLVDKLLTPEKEIQGALIEIEKGKIQDISGKTKNPRDGYTDFSEYIAVPGFIDVHTHGYQGHRVTGGDRQDLSKISKSFLECGVTSFLPTTVSSSEEKILETCKNFHKLKDKNQTGANILGLHLEGPYLGSGEEKGAQSEEALREPDIEELENFFKTSGKNISRITLAPELPNSLDFIKRAQELGITISAGHTNASYEEAMKSFDMGVSICSHLFNGMKAFHHRNPGIVGACLTRDDVFAEMIPDMVHLHPATIDTVVRAKGIDNSILVTDSIFTAGLSDGEYDFDMWKIIAEDGVSRLKSNGRLAGSNLTMDQAVRNMEEELDYDLDDIFKMVSLNPALALGLEKRGKIQEGFVADITILNRDLDVVATMVNGEIKYRCD